MQETTHEFVSPKNRNLIKCHVDPRLHLKSDTNTLNLLQDILCCSYKAFVLQLQDILCCSYEAFCVAVTGYFVLQLQYKNFNSISHTLTLGATSCHRTLVGNSRSEGQSYATGQWMNIQLYLFHSYKCLFLIFYVH